MGQKYFGHAEAAVPLLVVENHVNKLARQGTFVCVRQIRPCRDLSYILPDYNHLLQTTTVSAAAAVYGVWLFLLPSILIVMRSVLEGQRH